MSLSERSSAVYDRAHQSRLKFGTLRHLPLTLGGGAVAAVGVGLLASLQWPVTYLSSSLTLAVLALVVAVEYGSLRHATVAKRWLSPGYVFSLIWLLLFIVRPILLPDETTLRGTYYIAEALASARWLALLASIGFLLGLLVVRTRNPNPRSPVAHRPPRTWAAYLLGLVGVAGLVLQFGSGLGGSTAYLYYTPLLIVGAANALYAIWVRSNSAPPTTVRLLTHLAVVAFCAHFVLIGQRAFVLFALSLVVPPLLRSRGSKSTVAAVSLAIAVILAVTALLVWRSTGEIAGGVRSELLEETVVGPTTEMLPSLALLVGSEGTFWTQQPGRLASTILVHWVPRPLWSDKPIGYAEEVYAQAFPSHYALSRANTQFSLIGDFLTDSGWVGVFIGFFLTGVALSLWAKRSLYPGSVDGHSWAFIPILFALALRGDLGLIVGIGAFLYLPMFLVWQRSKSRRVGRYTFPRPAPLPVGR